MQKYGNRSGKKKLRRIRWSTGALSTYPTKKTQYIEAKNKLPNNAKSFYKEREEIIEGFKNGIFSLIMIKKKNKSLGIKRKKISEMKMVSLIMRSLRD